MNSESSMTLEVYEIDDKVDPFAPMAEDATLVPGGFEFGHQLAQGDPRVFLGIADSPTARATIERTTPLLEKLLPPGRTVRWQLTGGGFRSHVLGERLFTEKNVRAALPELVELLGAQLTLELDESAEQALLRRGDIHGQRLAIVDSAGSSTRRL